MICDRSRGPIISPPVAAARRRGLRVADNTAIFAAALACWHESDASRKAALTRALRPATGQALPPACRVSGRPGAPARPLLVAPRELPRRGLGSRAGHAAFIHAICHIEFSAINLALDAALRFPAMPPTYYRDWLSVAVEEARHFGWLADHLRTLGYAYGDFPAHNGLWAVAEKTADDVLARMALVPRVLEARGLDVTPGMIERLAGYGDTAGTAILRRILADEIGHVAIGSRWFRFAAAAAGEAPDAAFRRLVTAAFGRPARTGLNRAAREQAGFSARELDWLGA